MENPQGERGGNYFEVNYKKFNYLSREIIVFKKYFVFDWV